MLFVATMTLLPSLTTVALQNFTAANLQSHKNQAIDNCYKPQSVTSDIDGYAEGHINAKKGFLNGKEIVYNFASFQRKIFSQRIDPDTSVGNGGNYVSTIDGFVTNQAASTDFSLFRAQYEFLTVQIQMN